MLEFFIKGSDHFLTGWVIDYLMPNERKYIFPFSWMNFEILWWIEKLFMDLYRFESILFHYQV